MHQEERTTHSFTPSLSPVMTNANIQHPLENGQQVVMVRSTAPGFEQGIAALTGLCTAGPLGAIAAWGALRGLQGKWMPWALLGVPAAPILVGVQIAIGAAVLAPADSLFEGTSSPSAPQSRTYQVPDATIKPTAPQAAWQCRVLDQSDTYVNVRATPNGVLVKPLTNGTPVTVTSTANDFKGREWMKIAGHGGFIMGSLVDCS